MPLSDRARVTLPGAGDPDPGVPPQLEVVIPALNEEARIGSTLVTLTDHLARLPITAGVVVVDNGSADATADVVQRAARGRVPVRLIGCRTRGKGAAVKAGVLGSASPWVGFCDADLSTPVSALDGVVALLATGAPVVIGSRRCDGAAYATAQPPLRRAGGWAFRALARPLTGDVADTQCGFKFFRREVAAALFAGVTSTGFTFDVELLAAAHRRSVPVVELPVEWTDQRGSTLRPLEHGPQVLRELRTLRRLHSAAQRATAAGERR
ncbi:glycosyltransferase [Rhodococcus aerolatus]